MKKQSATPCRLEMSRPIMSTAFFPAAACAAARRRSRAGSDRDLRSWVTAGDSVIAFDRVVDRRVERAAGAGDVLVEQQSARLGGHRRRSLARIADRKNNH